MDIDEAIRNSKPEQFKGVVYRIYNPEHGFLETIGSYLKGGRWNRKEKYGALYTSLSQKTAIREAQHQAEKMGLKPSDLGPRDCVLIEVSLNQVLNLTKPDFYKALGMSQDEVLNDGEICLQIADEARKQGYDALLTPSVTHTGDNLVIYMDSLIAGWKMKEKKREKDIDLDAP